MKRHEQILVLSTSVDQATDAVVDELVGRGLDVVRVDTDDYPYGLPIALEPGSRRLLVANREILPTAVWYRRIRAPVGPADMDPGVHEYCVREAQTMIQGIGLSVGCPVMSEPGAIFAAENKVRQLVLAQKHGLVVPETCIANDPAAVRAFVSKHRRLVCKPLRSGWFEDQDGQWSIYTTEVDSTLREHLDEVALSPCIFQVLIEKKCDVRVTFVGNRVFVAEIDSQSDPDACVDWRRTTNPELAHRRADLPTNVESKLRAYMDSLGLRFGAVDLIRTPEDAYVFLEVNPNGQWLWLDDQLNLGITVAVADWLERAHE